MTIEEFLFKAFRDTARRVLWPVDAGKNFESQEYCSKFYSADIRKLAEEALISGDTRNLDDTLSRLLFNLNADFGYDTKRPEWWSDAEAQTSMVGTGETGNVSSKNDEYTRPSHFIAGPGEYAQLMEEERKKLHKINGQWPTRMEVWRSMRDKNDCPKEKIPNVKFDNETFIFVKTIDKAWGKSAYKAAWSRAVKKGNENQQKN